MMKEFLDKLMRGAQPEDTEALNQRLSSGGAAGRQVGALFNVLMGIWGPERLVVKAGKLDALGLMKSEGGGAGAGPAAARL